MFRGKRSTLGGWLLFALIGIGFCALKLLPQTNLFWHGITTQGVITGVGTVYCGGWHPMTSQEKFSVQFTDRTGQGYTSTISQCDYEGFNASPGNSVAIVYLPDNPTEIAPPDGLLTNVQLYLFGTILYGLITLLLLPFWIRKQIRTASLQRQGEQAAAERWRAMAVHLAHPNGDYQD
jgi:hypothetical protein